MRKIARALLLALALLVWSAVPPPSTFATSVILTINDVPSVYGIAFVDTGGLNKIYVSNFDNETVSVIDPRSHTIAGTISVGLGPAYLAFNPNTKKLYVSNVNSSSISVIDVRTDSVIKTITNITRAGRIEVNSTLNRVYVLSSNIIVVLDGASDQVLNPPINIRFDPPAFGILQNSIAGQHTIYAVRGTDRSVVVIDGSTQTEKKTLPLPSGGIDVAIDPLAMKVYVLSYGSLVTVIDANTNTEVSSFQVPGMVAGEPLRLFTDPSQKKLYFLFRDKIISMDTGIGPGTLTEIDVQYGAANLAVWPANHRIYVANKLNNKIQVVGDDLSSLTLEMIPEGIFTSGRNGTFRITVKNKGKGVSEGEVGVVVTLPLGFSFATSTGGDWRCTAVGQVVTCSSFRPIKPADISTFEMVIAASSQAVPVADVAAMIFNESDDDASDNQLDPVVTVKTGSAGVDLAVDGATGGTFRPGTIGTYELLISNVGTMTTSDTTELSSDLPKGTSFVSYSGPGWSCAAAGQVVTCTHIGRISSGSSSNLTLSVSVSDKVRPESINMVRVSSGGDANSYNNWVPVHTLSVPVPSGFLISSDDDFNGPSGGEGKIAVVGGPSAGSWSSSSDSPSWLQITSGSHGSGSGEVHFTTQPNNLPNPRTGTVTVAGLPYSVTQAMTFAGPKIDFVSTFDESGVVSDLTAADSPSQIYPSRRSEYYDLCGLSRLWGAAIQVTSSDFNPQMFLYDSSGRLVAHSMHSFADRGGDTTTWLPGFTHISGNNFNIGFFRFPAGERYTLEVTSDPTPQNPQQYGTYQLRVLKSLRDIVPGIKSPVGTFHNFSPLPYNSSSGTFYIEDYLNADMRRHYSADMILKNVRITGLDANPVTLLNLGFQITGKTKDFYGFDTTGTMKIFDPPGPGHVDSKYMGGATFSGSIYDFDSIGKLFHNNQNRDFFLEWTRVVNRCPTLNLDPYPSVTVGPSEATGIIKITREPVCTWEACSDSSWLTFTSPTSGSGSGTLTYKVSSYPGTAFRLGYIQVNFERVLIDQRATRKSTGHKGKPSR